MNVAVLMGRLTRDPDVRRTQAEEPLAIARWTLAVDRRTKAKDGKREADFISCIAFGKTAEFAEKYLRKGMKITLSGRIQTGSYTNKDGMKVYTTDVVVGEIEFAESKKDDKGQDDYYDSMAAESGAWQQAGDRAPWMDEEQA